MTPIHIWPCVYRHVLESLCSKATKESMFDYYFDIFSRRDFCDEI